MNRIASFVWSWSLGDVLWDISLVLCTQGIFREWDKREDYHHIIQKSANGKKMNWSTDLFHSRFVDVWSSIESALTSNQRDQNVRELSSVFSFEHGDDKIRTRQARELVRQRNWINEKSKSLSNWRQRNLNSIKAFQASLSKSMLTSTSISSQSDRCDPWQSCFLSNLLSFFVRGKESVRLLPSPISICAKMHGLITKEICLSDGLRHRSLFVFRKSLSKATRINSRLRFVIVDLKRTPRRNEHV